MYPVRTACASYRTWTLHTVTYLDPVRGLSLTPCFELVHTDSKQYWRMYGTYLVSKSTKKAPRTELSVCHKERFDVTRTFHNQLGVL